MPKKEQIVLEHALRGRYESIVAGQREFFNIPSMATPRIPRIGHGYSAAVQRVLLYSAGFAAAYRGDRIVEALPRNCAKLLMDARRALFVSGVGINPAAGNIGSFLEEIAVGGLRKREQEGNEGWRASQAFVAADIELLDPHVIMVKRSLLREEQGHEVLAFLRSFGRQLLPFDTADCGTPVPQQ